MDGTAGKADACSLHFSFRDETGAVEDRCFAEPVAVIEAQRIEQVHAALRRAHAWAKEGHFVAGFEQFD